MKKSKIFIIILLLFFPTFIYGEYELERADIYDYKKFFDDLFPTDDGNNADSCIDVGEVYAECSGVTVSGYGTYSLDEYVAGVLAAEFSFTIQNDDLGKSEAIITRSYTLAHTNNCKNSITSSSNEQNFSGSDHTTYRKYADDTSGIVMANPDGSIVLAVYSLATASDCEATSDNMCKFKRCTVYAESIAGCSGKVTEFIVPRGTITYTNHDIHYGGNEPYIAKYLALEKHYDYIQLLKAFYGDDISLARLTPTNSTSSGSSKKNKVSNENKLNCDVDNSGEYVMSDDVKFTFKNYNIEGTSKGLGKSFDTTASNVSQCPWYAKYRAIEIVESSTLSQDLKDKAKSVLLSTFGNGNMWYGGTNSNLRYFKYTSDVNKPKAGSIVAWERNSHNYGHVGIVEKVNSDGSIVVSEGWNRFGAEASDTVSAIKIITRTMTIDEVKTYGGTGSFIGYTYLLSHKK